MTASGRLGVRRPISLGYKDLPTNLLRYLFGRMAQWSMLAQEPVSFKYPPLY